MLVDVTSAGLKPLCVWQVQLLMICQQNVLVSWYLDIPKSICTEYYTLHNYAQCCVVWFRQLQARISLVSWLPTLISIIETYAIMSCCHNFQTVIRRNSFFRRRSFAVNLQFMHVFLQSDIGRLVTLESVSIWTSFVVSFCSWKWRSNWESGKWLN